MAIYSYTGTTLDGTLVEGVVEASDERIVVEQLQSTGVIPLKITAPKEGLKKRFAFKAKIKGSF